VKGPNHLNGAQVQGRGSGDKEWLYSFGSGKFGRPSCLWSPIFWISSFLLVNRMTRHLMPEGWRKGDGVGNVIFGLLLRVGDRWLSPSLSSINASYWRKNNIVSCWAVFSENIRVKGPNHLNGAWSMVAVQGTGDSWSKMLFRIKSKKNSVLAIRHGFKCLFETHLYKFLSMRTMMIIFHIVKSNKR